MAFSHLCRCRGGIWGHLSQHTLPRVQAPLVTLKPEHPFSLSPFSPADLAFPSCWFVSPLPKYAELFTAENVKAHKLLFLHFFIVLLDDQKQNDPEKSQLNPFFVKWTVLFPRPTVVIKTLRCHQASRRLNFFLCCFLRIFKANYFISLNLRCSSVEQIITHSKVVEIK